MRNLLLLVPVVFGLLACSQTADGIAKYKAGRFQESAKVLMGSNDPAGRYYLHLMRLEGQGIEKNEKVALDLLRESSGMGYPLAMAALGERLVDGKGVEKDESKGLSLLNQASTKGELQATVALGNYYLRTDKKDPGRGLSYLKAAEATWQAKYWLGLYYEEKNDNKPAEPKIALRYWNELVTMEGAPPHISSHARFHVAQFLYYGFGIPKDLLAAAKVLEPTKEDEADAFYGWMLFHGEGVERDPARAIRIWEKNGGASFHQHDKLGLALAYASGIGVARDYPKSRELLSKIPVPSPFREGGLWKTLFIAQGLTGEPCEVTGTYKIASDPVDLGTMYQTLAARVYVANAQCLLDKAAKQKDSMDQVSHLFETEMTLRDAEKLGDSNTGLLRQQLRQLRTGLSAEAKRSLVHLEQTEQTLSKSLEKLLRPSVTIGMTAKQVKESNWGAPLEVKRTQTSSGTTEQWVYGGKNHLYFRNGILEAIQN